MNKKSAILFFSVLFLVGVVFYAWAAGSTIDFTVSHTAIGDSFSTYTVSNWIKGEGNESINFTVTVPAIQDANGNISSVTVEFAEAQKFALHNWPNDTLSHTFTAAYTSAGGYIEDWGCNDTGVDNLEYRYGSVIPGNMFDNWTCWNTSAVSQLGAGDIIYVAINMSTNTSADDERASELNYTFILAEANGTRYTSEYDDVFYIDDQSPRLIEVNISDGNTTYHNATWDTVRIMNGPMRIEALIEDSQLASTVILGYNCNSSNGTFAGQNGGYAVNEVLTVTNQGVGTIDQRGNVTSSWIDCSSWNILGGNETFNFNFLVNDTLNHVIELNDSSGASQGAGSFQVILDDGELLPVIANVNVTQTTVTGIDGITTVSKTLSHGSELDGSTDYLKANTLTFDITLTGGYKPLTVMVVWNETGEATTSLVPVIGATTGWIDTNLDVSAALNATNITTGAGTGLGQLAEENTTSTTYRTTLDLSGNSSNHFAFWVYANNTENNYTRLSGPHRFQIDSGVPSITMTPPTDRVITPKASITYSCKMSDGISGDSKMMWQLKKPSETDFTTKQNYADVVSGSDSITFTGDDTNLAGTYDVRCLAIDAVGNEGTYTASSTENFAVHYSTTEAGVGAGEGAGAAADLDFTTQEEITVKEKQGVITTFTLDGTTVHTITIKTVDETAGTVTIVIESDPITITLKIGETKEVDIDADGANDISVTLNGITDGAADITTKRLTPLPTEKPTEEVPPTEKPAEEITPTPEAASKTWLWILIIVIIVVIGAGYWFMKRK